MTKKTAEEITRDLAQFTGTEHHYKHFLSRLVYTDGVKYVADACGAYWLLDVIASYQGRCLRDPKLSEMQFWTLKVDLEKGKGLVTCERDEGDVAIRQRIPSTDFPLAEIKIWVENNTMYLPSER
jgi:hypothetical protein